MPVLERSLPNEMEMEPTAPHRGAKSHVPARKPGIDLFRRVGTKELCRIARQLSALLHAGAAVELAAVADALQAPVTCSWGARGVLDESSSLAIPNSTLGTAKNARTRSDLFLVLGSRLGETDWWGRGHHWGGSKPDIPKRCIQVDIDGDIIGRHRPADLAIVADVKGFLAALEARLRENPVDEPLLAARREQVAELAAEKAAIRTELDAALQNNGAPMHPADPAPSSRQGNGVILRRRPLKHGVLHIAEPYH